MENAGAYYFVFDHQRNYPRSVYESLLYRLNPYQPDGKTRPSPETLESERFPLGEPLFRFDPGKYPVCMGCGTLGTKFFFLGGYMVPKGVAPEDACYCHGRKYSDKLYILDTTHIESTSSTKKIEDKIETHMLDVKKTRPIVLTVGNRLFVLPRNFGAANHGPPSIQSYDPHSKEGTNTNLFPYLKHDPSFFKNPSSDNDIKDLQLSPMYDVLAYCVKGNEIIIVLDVGTYSFNAQYLKLQRVGPQRPYLRKHLFLHQEPPFIHQGACVDDIIFGILERSEWVAAYKESPFGLSVKEMISKSAQPAVVHRFEHTFIRCNGLMLPVEDASGKKLLIIRNGRGCSGIKLGDTIYFTLDFLTLVKDANGPRCDPNHSTLYYLDAPKESEYYPIACLPILQMNEIQSKSSAGGRLHPSKNVLRPKRSLQMNEIQSKSLAGGRLHPSKNVLRPKRRFLFKNLHLEAYSSKQISIWQPILVLQLVLLLCIFFLPLWLLSTCYA